MTASLYEVRLGGYVPADLLAELDVTSLIADPSQTVLCTELADQAAIFGLLSRVRAEGLELIELRPVSDPVHGVAGE